MLAALPARNAPAALFFVLLGLELELVLVGLSRTTPPLTFDGDLGSSTFFALSLYALRVWSDPELYRQYHHVSM